jgi:hypothetical protein
MTVEFPGYSFMGVPLPVRQFNGCVSTKVASTLMKQTLKEPLKPIQNFAECALSETILKPVDNGIRDIKNAIADVVDIGKNPGKAAGDPLGLFKKGISTVSSTLHKGLAGTYLMLPNFDSIECFQAKTMGVQPQKEIVDINWIIGGLTDMKFLNGERVEPTPFLGEFSRKMGRKKCDDHDEICKV